MQQNGHCVMRYVLKTGGINQYILCNVESNQEVISVRSPWFNQPDIGGKQSFPTLLQRCKASLNNSLFSNIGRTTWYNSL